MAFKRWLISGLLAALALFFAIQAANVWTAPASDDAGDAEPARRPHTAARPGPRPPAPPLQTYRAIAERNLFTPERRSASAIGALPALPMAGGQGARKITLRGVVIQPGDRKALVQQIRRGSPKEEGWVRVGDRIDQLQVVGIEPERLILQEGQQVYDIKISDRAESRPPRPPGPPTSAKKPEVKPPPQQTIIVDEPRPDAGQPPTQEKPQ